MRRARGGIETGLRIAVCSLIESLIEASQTENSRKTIAPMPAPKKISRVIGSMEAMLPGNVAGMLVMVLPWIYSGTMMAQSAKHRSI